MMCPLLRIRRLGVRISPSATTAEAICIGQQIGGAGLALLAAKCEHLGARQVAHRVDFTGVDTTLEPGRVGPGPVDRHGVNLRWRVDDLAPWRQPALLRRVRVEQHPHPHAAHRLQARGERRVAGELGLAVWHHHDRDAVAGHLAQQARREVIRVAMGELIDAVERQRAREHRIGRRDRRARTRRPILRSHRLAGQLLKFGGPGGISFGLELLQLVPDFGLAAPGDLTPDPRPIWTPAERDPTHLGAFAASPVDRTFAVPIANSGVGMPPGIVGTL
jgi:hypothetical protein